MFGRCLRGTPNANNKVAASNPSLCLLEPEDKLIDGASNVRRSILEAGTKPPMHVRTIYLSRAQACASRRLVENETVYETVVLTAEIFSEVLW